MGIQQRISELHEEMTGWRRDLHAHPETAFEERRTSAFVAEKLKEFGIEVHTGIARTGIVGVLRGKRAGDATIGLRADMDALHIHEQTNKPYSSKTPGKMHACGHDGHTTMLLGAAKYLAETRDFAGTAYFIFQPAEENEGGGKVMVEEGLFDRFPMQAVYGMHNWPGAPAGEIGLKVGPMLAAADTFEIIVAGHGAHGAMPHQGIDPVVVAAQIVSAAQTITSRNVDPLEACVVSVTQIHAGDTWNVIPEEAVLRGTTRAFKRQVQEMTKSHLERLARGIAAANGASAEFRYHYGYPPTVNSQRETEHAGRVAEKLVGRGMVVPDVTPVMGAEDFSFMLQERPGSYVWLGAGEDEPNLHSPQFDFNDAILPIGAGYWATLVEETLK